jgi:hypothetical protein
MLLQRMLLLSSFASPSLPAWKLSDFMEWI